MDNSNFSKRFWGIVFALTFLASVGAVAKALGATDPVAEKNLQALPAPTSTQNPPPAAHPDEDTAADAGKEFSSGAGSLGRGFVKGAKVTGSAFKTAGKTMAKGFKKAGTSIRDYFLGKKESDLQESDLSVSSVEAEAAASQRDPASVELDAVGNDMPRQAEPKKLSKQGKSKASEVN
ncbi:MAG: hypothetical protein U1F66_08670 [bacterium]